MIRRHGPLVLNICRKLLSDRLDVEDAFQATFLVLVRKAGSLRFEESLAPWISTVAYRIAARARARRIRQNAQERATGQLPDVPAPPGENRDETSRVVYEELGRLPERLRLPIICCYLDGMTHEAAAAHLACPVGTVRSRLARARARLQVRLARRGVTLAEGTAGMMMLRSSSHQISAKLLRSTISLVLDSGLQTAGAGVASASILHLVEGVLSRMILRKAIIIGSVLLPLGALLTAGAALAFPQSGEKASRVAPREKAQARREREEDAIPHPSIFIKTYYVGDLLGVEANGKRSQDAPAINMIPLIDLIQSTIAPGTWRVIDGSGKEIRIEGNSINADTKSHTDPERRIGSLRPFFLSISLIVRDKSEVHDQVAKLLKFLRDFKYQRPAQSMLRSSPPSPGSQPASAQERLVDGHADRKKRLKQLLWELQREINAMDHESDRPTGTVEPPVLKK